MVGRPWALPGPARTCVDGDVDGGGAAGHGGLCQGGDGGYAGGVWKAGDETMTNMSFFV